MMQEIGMLLLFVSIVAFMVINHNRQCMQENDIAELQDRILKLEEKND